jgi:hypothetical protein
VFQRKKEVYLPSQLVHLKHRGSWLGGGMGDVIFKTVVTITITTRKHGPSDTSRSEKHYGFLAVENSQKVEKLVRETLVDRFLDKLSQANDLE